MPRHALLAARRLLNGLLICMLQVIKGWDQGVEGMRVGDIRRLTVPAVMGYGAAGARPAIPPNAALDFTVELVNVK